jgi:regulator of sigma E protease
MFMILIHELGHYSAAKLLKFKINEFAIGMGPKILSRTNKSGEVVSLRAFPLGGFCAFEGEDDDASNPDAFNNQKPWKRLIVTVAGAVFNFISAIIIGVIVFSCYGDPAVNVVDIYDYAPVENRILQVGDMITAVDGQEVYLAGDFSSQLSRAGEIFNLTVKRNGKYVTLNNLKKATFVITYVDSTTRNYYSAEDKEYALGKGDQIYSINGVVVEGANAIRDILASASGTLTVEALTGNGVRTFSIDKSEFIQRIYYSETPYSGVGMSINYVTRTFTFAEALKRVVPYCFRIAYVVLRTLGQLLTGGLGVEAIGGPITTISMTSQVVATGFGNVLNLIVMISVNLAVFNLLPVPALDGCKMVFILIEWIRRKPVNRKVEAYINGIGLVVLFALVLLIDLLKL